jgi:TPR repeat protein
MLGVCYLEGSGIAMDPVQAFALFMKTKDQAYGSGLMGLFRCYDKGLGIPKNEVEAYAYLTQPAIRLSLKAEGVSEDDFQKSVANYEKRLTAEQITAGKIRAKEIEKEIEAKIASKKARK